MTVQIEPSVQSAPSQDTKTKLLSPVVNCVLLGVRQTLQGARRALLAWQENFKKRIRTTKQFVQTAESDNTLTAPTRSSAKIVIAESTKSKQEKQHVFPACLESTGDQTRRTAATVTNVKLARHQLNLVARSRAKHQVQVLLFSAVGRRQ